MSEHDFFSMEDLHPEVDKFFEELKAEFPDVEPVGVIAMLFLISMNDWKFPDYIHQSPMDEVATFIENNDTLRNCFVRKIQFSQK